MRLKKRMKKTNRSDAQDKFLLSDESGFAIQEAYKALRTNVIFSLPGSDSKCIAITSAAQGDGKSTNALNLAISFGQIGKKVIVLDGDMRLPTVASKLGIKAVPGLSNILVGTSTPEECIQHVETVNIDVIPSGIIPPDTTVLLQSSQMAELIGALRKKYEYIFIDLPPVLGAIDAVMLSPLVDGFLLAVRHGETEFHLVSSALKQMKYADAKILGVIYTNADLNSKGKSYYHYNYYGYGNKHEES